MDAAGIPTILDISVPVGASLPVYAGDPPTTLEPWARMADGALADLSRLQLGTHTGTHVDAPAHFIPGGRAVDQLDLTACCGAAEVVDLTAAGFGPIDAGQLAARLTGRAERVVLRTRNSELWSEPAPRTDFAALTMDAAEFLVDRGVRLVGIDYLSIAPASDPAPVHRQLLSAGIVILEGLDLSRVAAGSYTLVCLPLRLAGADGAPARAVLLPPGSIL